MVSIGMEFKKPGCANQTQLQHANNSPLVSTSIQVAVLPWWL